MLFTLLLLTQVQDPLPGRWHGALEGPGGPIPFELELREDAGAWSATLLEPVGAWRDETAVERYGRVGIEPMRVARDGDRLVLSIEHYDSHLEGELSKGGSALAGHWRKRTGPDAWATLPFRAAHGPAPQPKTASRREPTYPRPVTGRWSVAFSESPDPAVMELAEDVGGAVRGTILTTTGDYRFLTGRHERDELVLATFDGAHAFHLAAKVRKDADGWPAGPLVLAGDFWSRDTWHETWTAREDADARLPDPFTQTVWAGDVALADLAFPDLDGEVRSLADLAGKALVLQVFGTWCPTCNDETRLLVELDERFRERGLAIVGLAFELTGDRERDAAQVRAYAERHGVRYPLLLAGTADKADATEALAALDRVRAYPTTIFLTADGRVRAVHSGFAGPAAGPAHEALRAEFERLIGELLAADDDALGDATWTWLREVELFEAQGEGAGHVVFRDADGERSALLLTHGDGAETRREELPVRVAGETVWIGDALWRVEPDCAALLSPHDPGARLVRQHVTATLLGARGHHPLALPPDPPPGEGESDAAPAGVDGWLLGALADPDGRVRREAVWHLAQSRQDRGGGLPEVVPLLADADRRVRLCAAWALGATGEPGAIQPLFARLASRDAELRRESVRALGRLARLEHLAERTAAIPNRLQAVADDPDPRVRAAVAATLE
jgi:peroxiredoxin